MGASEELSIIVRMRDFASKEFARVNSFVGSTVRGIFSLKGALVGLAGAYAVRGIYNLVEGTAAAADNIQKMSLRLGTSTEFLSEMEYAAQRSGASLADVETAVRNLDKNLEQLVNTGSGEAAYAMGLLSEDFKNLVDQTRDAEVVIPALSRELRGLSETERVFVASKLFGRSGTAIIPLLTDDVDKLRARAKELGLTLSKDVADNAADFEDALLDVKSAFEGLKRSAVLTILPELTKGMQGLAGYIIDHRAEFVSATADVVETASSAALWIARVIVNMKELAGIPGALAKRATSGNLAVTLALGLAEVGAKAELSQQKIDKLEGSAGALVARFRELAKEQRKNAADDDAWAERTEMVDGWRKGVADAAAKTREAEIAAIKLGEAWQEHLEKTNPLLDANILALQKESIEAEKQYQAILRIYDARTGAASAFATLSDRSRQFGRIAEDSILAASDAVSYDLADNLLAAADRTKTLSEAFKAMTSSILHDLARISLNQTFSSLIGAGIGALGGAFSAAAASPITQDFSNPSAGGLISGLVQDIPVRDSGGYATRPGFFKLDNRPEAVVPLSGGAIPVDLRGAGQSVIVNYSPTFFSPAHEAEFLSRNRDQVKAIVVEAMNSSMGFRSGMRGVA